MSGKMQENSDIAARLAPEETRAGGMTTPVLWRAEASIRMERMASALVTASREANNLSREVSYCSQSTVRCRARHSRAFTHPFLVLLLISIPTPRRNLSCSSSSTSRASSSSSSFLLSFFFLSPLWTRNSSQLGEPRPWVFSFFFFLISGTIAK